MLIFALFAMSLDLLLGYTGLASLGHAAFFGVAAYTVALLFLRAGVGSGIAFPAALAAAAATGRGVRAAGAARARQLFPDDHLRARPGGVERRIRLAHAHQRR